MKNKLKTGLGALVLSATALLNSGCEICGSSCTSIKRLPPEPAGCYQSLAPTGCYQQGQVYQPSVSVCAPAYGN